MGNLLSKYVATFILDVFETEWDDLRVRQNGAAFVQQIPN